MRETKVHIETQANKASHLPLSMTDIVEAPFYLADLRFALLNRKRSTR